MKLQIDAKKNEQGEYIFQGQPIHIGDDLIPRQLRSTKGKVFIKHIKGIEDSPNVKGVILVDIEEIELTTEQTVQLLKLMKKA